MAPGQNLQIRRGEALKDFQALGLQHKQGRLAMAEVFKVVVNLVTEGVFTRGKKDLDLIFDAFADTDTKVSTVYKIRSQLNKVMQAAALEDVDFRTTGERVLKVHEQWAVEGHVRRQASEAIIQAARMQMEAEQQEEPLSQEQIEDCVKPFKSGGDDEGEQRKAPTIFERAAKAVEKLTEDEARRILDLLLQRFPQGAKPKRQVKEREAAASAKRAAAKKS